MIRLFLILTVAVAMAAVATPVAAIGGGKKAPHEKVTADIDGNKITLDYGRPFTNDKADKVRKIWGGLVPYGQPWRTGADQATQFTITMPIKIGEETIPAGTYTIYTIPEAKGCKMAFGKTTGKWGIPVDTKNDLIRVDMKVDPVEKAVDQFTMAIDKGAKEGGVLKMTWENAQYSVAFINAPKK